MREEKQRAGGAGRLTCVGCGAPVGHNNLKYTREMCLRCYARMLSERPVGEQGTGSRPRRAAEEDEKPRE